MDLRYEIVTTPKDDGTILQEVRCITADRVERMTSWAIDTREEQIRQALIALGWTPPPTT